MNKKSNIFPLQILSVMMAAAVLASCSAQQAGAPATSENAAPSAPPAGDNAPAGELKMLSLSPDDTGAQACTDQGMYWVESEDGRSMIHYWDLATGQATYLCASPNCQHTDDSCTAFATSTGFAPSIGVDEEHLYLFFIDYNDGQNEYPARIEVGNLDGGDRHTLYTFGSGQTMGAGVVSDGARLYLTRSTVSPEGAYSNELISLDVNTGELTTLYSADEGYLFVLGTDGDELWIKEITTDGIHKVSTYAPATGAWTPRTEYEQEQMVGYASGPWWFQLEPDGEQVTLTATDGTQEIHLPDCFPSVQGTAGIYVEGYYHDTLFVDSVTGVEEDSSLQVKMFAINCQTGQVVEFPFTDAVTGRPLQVVGAAGPEEDILILENNAYNGTTQTSWERTFYQAIPFDDCMAGTANFTNIN